MTFRAGYEAVLDEAKIFIHFLTDKTPYVDKLHLEGSNDDWLTSVLLHTFGEEIHEGWNFINFDENKPAYNSYKFVGEESCKVTEFRLTGVEAIQN